MNLIPDSQNPIHISPNRITGSPIKIDLRFKFSPGSYGLIYSNYLAVEFSEKMIDYLNYSLKNTPKYKCELTDSNQIAYKLEAESTNEIEKNIAFCKFTDKAFSQINNSKISFKLTITFDQSVKILPMLSKIIKLYTCSSTSTTRYIIDQAIFMGNIELYNDSQETKLINIEKSSIKIGTSTKLKIYPFQEFDVHLSIISNTFLSNSDFTLVFKFNKDYIGPPQSASSDNFLEENPKENIISGPLIRNLIVNTSFGDGMISLTGIEDLIPNKKFTLILKNFRALEKTTDVSSPLEMIIYYKNTYSVFTHIFISQDFLKISPAEINITANHPDEWDIFRNGIFPMTFSFKSERDLFNGGFVLIQHVNAENLKNKFNFVASTCDFSVNDKASFSQSFGRRSNCYPIRTDFNYPNSNIDNNPVFNGSGVFFYMNQILANKIYYLTVWGSADACGGSNLVDFGSAISTNSNTSTKFEFKLTVYNSINSNELNEKRFSSINIIGESIAQKMINRCWNTQNQIIADNITNNDDSKRASSLNPFKESLFKEISIVDSSKDCSSSEKACDLVKDVNLYREFNNFALININSSYSENLYFADMSKIEKFTEYYLYGSNTLTTNSNFGVKITYPTHAEKKFFEDFPSPITFHGQNPIFIPGRLVLNLQKRWFIPGDAPNTKNGCYLSWGTNAKSTELLGKDVIIDCPNLNMTQEQSVRYILSKNDASCKNKNSDFLSEIDIENSYIPYTGVFNTLKYYRIMSTFNRGDLGYEETKKRFFAFPLPIEKLNIKTAPNTTSISFGLYTSCFKWNTNFRSIKSLYTSIDIQLNWVFGKNSLSKDQPPIRSIRLIKLFPEGGVFQDFSINDKKIADTKSLPDLSELNGAQKPYKLHFGLGSDNTKTGICLIEIFTVGLVNLTSDSMSPVMAIWIGFGVLLEQDYNDLNSTYPIAPLAYPHYSTWGLQSGYVMNANENFNVHNSFKSLNPSKYSSNSIQLRLHLHNYSLTTDEYLENEAKYDSLLNHNNQNTSFNKVSHYFFLMGSLIMITNISGNSITTVNSVDNLQNNLLIPIYCPINDTVKKTINFLNGIPTLYITFLTMHGYNNIVSVNRIFSYKFQTDSKNQFVILTPNTDSDKYYRNREYFLPAKAFTGESDSTNYLFTLRWAPYTINMENVLYLYYGHIAENFSAQNKLNCTGHVLLINQNKVSIDSAMLYHSGINGGDPALYNGNKKFYYLGFEFHKAILIGLSSKYDVPLSENGVGMFTPQNLSNESSNYSISGIIRPTVESFYSNEKYNTPFNDIAYFCSSSHNSSYQMFSNYLYITERERYFILDFNSPVSSPSIFSIQVQSDKNEVIYKQDKASNARFSITLPAKVPGGAKLKFSMPKENMNESTICGLMNNLSNSDKNNKDNLNYPVNECENISGNEISCLLPRTDSNFQICCYNIILATETVKIDSIFITLPSASLSDNKYNIHQIYDNRNQVNQKIFSLETNQSTAIDIISSKSAEINYITYSHVAQDKGIGKAIFSITLPREPVRNSYIIISGDFISMLIPNTNPSCKVTFSNFYNDYFDGSADVFLDSCDTSNFNTTEKSIVIKLKNIIYKCGINFHTKNLMVSVYPILQKNFPTENKYKVLLGLNNSKNDVIADSSKTFSMKMKQEIKEKPLEIEKWDTLCKISSINPPIPGEMADYSFEFDLESYKQHFNEKNSPNEFSIFFPEILYGNSISELICYIENIIVNCSMIEDGILNIWSLTSLTIKKTLIVISGVYNPYYMKDIVFPCTINSIDFLTGNRINLITGSGKIEKGISLGNITQGKLRFINIPNRVLDANPRTTSKYIFRITFDFQNLTLENHVKLSVDPQVIIYFPFEYRLAYSNIKEITANIDEYISDTLGEVSKSKSLIISSINILGNKITILLNYKNYDFPKDFRYWEITLNNLPTPNESTETENFLPYSTTGLFNIILTTFNYNSIYRTFTNLNNFSSINLSKNTNNNYFDSFITNNRGIAFSYDNRKWVIDINNNHSLILYPGRFYKSNFSIRQDLSNNLIASSASITLEDKIFKLTDTIYNILILTSEPLTFYIGAPCGTPPGIYLLVFNLKETSDGSNFAPLAPLIVKLDSSKRGIIYYNEPSFVAAGGSVPLFYNLSDPNVDELKINWIKSDLSINDPLSFISHLNIPAARIPAGEIYNYYNQIIYYSIFSVKSKETKFNNIFKANPINECYEWKSEFVNFEIYGNIAEVPKQIDTRFHFKYANAESDNTIKENNTLKINFIIPYKPIYLYCALVCFEMPYPNDKHIFEANPADNSKNKLIKYYFGFFDLKSTSTNIYFNNLFRGIRYKLKCIISNTDSNTYSRKNMSISMDYVTNLNSTNTSMFATSPIRTQCLQYNFNKDPGDFAKKNILDYCQKLYSNNAWSKNGCIYCIDSSGKFISRGMNYIIPNISKSDCMNNNKKMRFLEEKSEYKNFSYLSEKYNNNTYDRYLNISNLGNFKIDNNTNHLVKFDNLENLNLIENFYYQNFHNYKFNTDLKKRQLQNNTNTIIEPDKGITYFSVCAVQYLGCDSNPLRNKTNSNIFNKLLEDTKTTENIKKNLGLSGISLNATFYVNDNSAPEISKNLGLKLIKNDHDPLTYIRIKISHTSPIICNWKISKSKAPSLNIDDIRNCNDKHWCGKDLIINSISNNFTTDLKNSNSFENNTDYFINFICENNVYKPEFVSKIFSFSIFSVNKSNLNSTDIKIPDTNIKISGTYIIMNFIYIFIIIFSGILNFS